GEAHAGDDDLEVLSRDVALRRDLGRGLEVGQSRRGEDGEFLTANERCERVDHRDPGEDRIARDVALTRIERRAAHGATFAGEHRRPSVEGLTHSVPDPAEPAVADRYVEGTALKGDAHQLGIDATRGLEDFDDRDVA